MIEVVFSSRVSLLVFYSSEKVLSAQVCSVACVSISALWLKTRIKLVLQRRINLGMQKTNRKITTNNKIQAGFNSVRRKKAKHWTQNQLTNRMHNCQKNTNLFGNVQNVYSTSDWRKIRFYIKKVLQLNCKTQLMKRNALNQQHVTQCYAKALIKSRRSLLVVGKTTG